MSFTREYSLSAGVREVQFCTAIVHQLFEFELATCKTCRLRSKKAILEVATSYLRFIYKKKIYLNKCSVTDLLCNGPLPEIADFG